ncbi:hypothetical protein HHI36_000814 [Cryptolaemus montrouzieri]|uniref:Endonuclease/exonuclease/phosphatase domain-containing protein n=1 Tax=Cryptolaemus montrouzieri TaxID=559131 RepID=A0ABD2P603_9CUCU
MVKNSIRNYKIYSSQDDEHDLPTSMEGVLVYVRIAATKFKLASVQNTLEGENEPIILGNYPEIDWSQAAMRGHKIAAREFLATYAQWTCYQLITSSTRLRVDSDSLLDLLLVPDERLVTRISSCPSLGLSDHTVLLATIQETKLVYKINFYKADYAKVNSYLAGELSRQLPKDITLCL